MKSAILFLSGSFVLGSIFALQVPGNAAGQSAGPAPVPAVSPPAVVPPGKFAAVDGSIRLPKDYRSWTHLGTWYVAEGKNGEINSHQVYAEPEAVAEFRETQRFPHGATIVKEVRSTKSGKLTTGPGTWDGPVQLWFVMVKDTKRTFPGNPIWGRGWGWGLYLADDPQKNTCTDYKIDCLGCHIPAEKTDWVFQYGYPALVETEGQHKQYMGSIYTNDEAIDTPAPEPKKLEKSMVPKKP
ncbi:hypothetical protein RAS2_28420 [Phycisphaerae bacterium RAS2]|nr:hypothetical protein RAS2_28420 [Phycisphaerae bacterium RAS2]